MSLFEAGPGSDSSRRDRPQASARPEPGAVPGLVVVLVVTALATALAHVLGLVSPILLALALGAAVGPRLWHAGVDAGPGADVASSDFLKVGVALLGFQVSLGDVATLGLSGVVVAAGTIVATFAGTVYLGRWLGVDRKLSVLLSAGTGICGASAVVALNEVVRAPTEQVSYAVATVTLLGTAALIAIPVLGVSILALGDHVSALWVGASVHEVAQVAAAAAAISPGAIATAALMKLARVALLAPTVVAAAAIGPGRMASPLALPSFLYAFFLLVVLHSVFALPGWALDAARIASALLLTGALAALGLKLRVSALGRLGTGPLVLGVFASIVAAGSSLLLLLLLGHGAR